MSASLEAKTREGQTFWAGEDSAGRQLRVVRMGFWSVAVIAGLCEMWATRFSLSPDATNYLDMASACLRGDWKMAVNAYWSPLFSWLLALAMAIFRPGAYWESTMVHIVNFVGFLAALGCFEYFLRVLLATRKEMQCGQEEAGGLPELGFWILGYGLFLSTTLFVLVVRTATPDIWTCAFTFLAGGLVLRILVRGGGWVLFAALGATLGCAYLSKAFYFPMSFVFLLTAWVAAGSSRRAVKQAAVGLLFFALVAGPWVAALSQAKGRLTFGDVGKIAMAATMDRVPRSHLWQGENGTGIPKHPVRRVLEKPQMFEYAVPVSGTYPPGFDWSYWMEGVKPYFNSTGLLAILRQSAGTYFQLFLEQAEYAVGMFALVFISAGKRAWREPVSRLMYLWGPALVACGSYAVVLVEGRYVAPFLLLLWMAAFCCAFQAASGISRRTAVALVLGVVAVTGLRTVKLLQSDLTMILNKPRNVDWEIAQRLHELGVRPGDQVSALGGTAEAQWAREAGVRFVSEIPLGEERGFWAADDETRRQVFRTFAGTGATTLITKDPPPGSEKEGWVPLGNMTLYVRVLREKVP
jgi:hypothetical protein